MGKYETFTGMYLSGLIKLSPHYFLRFSRLRHINKLVMLAARIFIASFAERRVLRGRIFEVWSVPSNKLHPFSPESFQFFLHLLIVRSASSAISPSSAFSFPTVIHFGLLFLHLTLRHKLVSSGILAAQFAIFCSKINQLSVLKKSSIFNVDTANFGIVHFELRIE